MLNPRFKSAAERVLPRGLLARLDPVQKIIDAEVESVARRSRDGQVILDAGAGEGRHKRYFARGHYVALDAGSGDASWDYSGLDVRGNLQELPLRPASIDGIVCMVVLEHTRRPQKVLEEFARVLKPGGSLTMVVPFLWEEHQAPHDYFRFTRHGIRLLFEGLPFRMDLVEPMGGFFWVCARRCVNLLGFFQRGWRWVLFVPLAPLFGFLFPLILHSLDRCDRARDFSLGFRIRATREET